MELPAEATRRHTGRRTARADRGCARNGCCPEARRFLRVTEWMRYVIISVESRVVATVENNAPVISQLIVWATLSAGSKFAMRIIIMEVT